MAQVRVFFRVDIMLTIDHIAMTGTRKVLRHGFECRDSPVPGPDVLGLVGYDEGNSGRNGESV
jgi:hypothetical protein